MWVFSESSLYLWILHLLFWENWSGTIWSLPRRGAQDNHKIFTKRFKFQGSKVPVCEHGKCTNTSRCLISSPQGAHFTPDLSVCEHLRKSHINTWHFSLVPGNGAIHYEHVQEGISGVGVRREGGGNGEVRRGRRGVQVKTDNTQRTKLLTCRVWTTSAHSPRDANLRLSGQVLQRIVPSCVMARHSQCFKLIHHDFYKEIIAKYLGLSLMVHFEILFPLLSLHFYPPLCKNFYVMCCNTNILGNRGL